MDWLMASPLLGTGANRVVVSGHSRAATSPPRIFATDPSRFTFDPRASRAACRSAPCRLRATAGSSRSTADFKLDDAAVRRSTSRASADDPAPLSSRPVPRRARSSSASRDILHEAWSPQSRALLLLPGLNHFSVVDAFTERGQPRTSSARAL
jgi:hypothetical protein